MASIPILAIDTESNTWNKGSIFDGRYKGVCYSWADHNGSGASPSDAESLERLGSRIAGASILVGFNIKYDLHVLRKWGVDWGDKEVWDCQLAEFVRSNQTWKYPSLAETAEKYQLAGKLDEVAEYWKRGVQTEDIPWDILKAYAVQDAQLTLEIYKRQQELLSQSQKHLIRLMCMDLIVLEEMEWNGIRWNRSLAEQRTEEITREIQGIETSLRGLYPDVPVNFGSGDHLSAFLYGGKIKEVVKEHVGFFKSGQRVGEPKYQNKEIFHELPRLVAPLRGSELKKEGFFSTNGDTLLKLRPTRATKHIIELIQKAVRLNTLLEKTYVGLCNKADEGNWEPGYIHGQFNQVTVATGRLSSSGPNLQNLDSAAQDLFVSRYE